MWDKWFRTGCALLVSGTLLFGSGFSPAVAEEEPPRTKRTQTISQDAYRRLNRVQELADAGEVDSALQLLERVQERASNDYEAAMALNLKAYIHYGQEQYDAAASAYASILAMQAVPESLRRNTLFSLAKIRFIQEDYAAALVPLRAWFEQTEEPGIDALLLLGQAHYQLGQYDEVVPPVRAAIELAEAQGREPRENWYLLLRAAHYQQNDFVAMRDVLRTLLEINPKREYWIQLGAVYAELGQEEKQLATLEAAYEQGVLEKPNDFYSFAQLLLAQGVPVKAVEVLNGALSAERMPRDRRNLELFADALISAKQYDRAVGVAPR